jgi:hypothetical protein
VNVRSWPARTSPPGITDSGVGTITPLYVDVLTSFGVEPRWLDKGDVNYFAEPARDGRRANAEPTRNLEHGGRARRMYAFQ